MFWENKKTISEYYKAILKNEVISEETKNKIEKLKEEINQQNKKEANLKKNDLAKKVDKETELTLKLSNLQEAISSTRNDIETRIKKLASSTNKKDKRELEDYRKLVLETEAKKIKKYDTERDNLLNSILEISKTKNLNEIIKKILASPDKNPASHKETLGIGNVLAGGAEVGFKNIIPIAKIASSLPYYISEGKKIKNGRDDKDPSFFFKLLDDPKIKKALDEILPNISKIVSDITPDIIATMFRVLSQDKSINDQINKLTKKREKLLSKPNHDPKLITKIDNSLGTLRIRQVISKAILALEQKGYNLDYINGKFSTLGQSLITESLKSSENCLKLANNLVDIGLADDRPMLIQSIVNLVSSDLIKNILSNEEIRETLVTEKNLLAELVTSLISNSELLDTKVKKLGISEEITKNIVKLGAEGAATLLPFAFEIMESLSGQKDKLVNIALKGYKSVEKFIDKKKSLPEGVDLPKKEIADELFSLIKESISLLQNEQSLTAFKSLNERLQSNEMLGKLMQDTARSILLNFQTNLKEVENIDKLIDDSISIAVKLAGAGLDQNQNIVDLAQNVIKLSSTILNSESDHINGLSSQEQQNFQDILESVNKFTTNPDVKNIINENLPNYLSSNQDILANSLISVLYNNQMVKNSIAEFGITEEINRAIISEVNAAGKILSDAVPFAIESISQLTDKDFLPEAIKALNNITRELASDTIININLEKSILSRIIQVAADFTGEAEKIGANILKDPITIKIIKDTIRLFNISLNEALTETAKQAKNDELLSKAQEITINVLKVINKEEFKGALESIGTKLQNNQKLENLIFQIVMLQISQFQNKQGQESPTDKLNLEPLVKDFIQFGLDLSGKSLAENGSILNIVEIISSNKSNYQKLTNTIKEVNSLINQSNLSDTIKKLPGLIDKHAEGLAYLTKQILNETKFGKDLNINIDKTLKVAAKKTPILIEVSSNYQQKKYFKMFKNIARIILSPSVIALAVETIWNITKKTIGQKSTNKNQTVKKNFANKVEQGRAKKLNIATPNFP